MQQNVGVFLESAESECPKRTVPSWLEWILSGDSEVTTRDSETMYRLSPAAWGCADGKACAWRRAIAAHNSELSLHRRNQYLDGNPSGSYGAR